MHIGLLAATVMVLAMVLPGVRVKNWASALAVAVVFSVINWATAWLITTLLFVPVVLTFGLLLLVVPFIVNLVVLFITDLLIEPFEIKNTRALLLSAAAITVANGVFHFALR